MSSLGSSKNRDMHFAMPYVVCWCVIVLSTILFAIFSDYFYFADASYFLSSILVDNVVEGVWQQFPRRVGAFLVTQWLALVSNYLGFSLEVVKYSYSFAFLSFPLACFLISVWLNRSLTALVCCGMIVSVLCLVTLGFPTEASVSAALIMLMTAALTSNVSEGAPLVVRWLILMVTPFLLVFSHESALLAIPAAIVVMWQCLKAGAISARLGAFTIFSLTVAISAWLYVFFELRPTNPLVETALQMNSKAVFKIREALSRPLPLIAVLGFLVPFLISLVPSRFKDFLLGILFALMLGVVQDAWRHDAVIDRYVARTVLTWLMPFLPLCIRYASGFGKKELAIVSMAVFLIAAVQLRSIHYWNEYKDQLVASALEVPTKTEARGKKSIARINGYRWDWALPYQVAILTSKDSRKHLLLDDAAWFSPLSCSSISEETKFERLFTQREIILLEEFVRRRIHCPN